ncbi:MAG: hypothetical protein CL537_16065 [Alcanivoracaceae bacterium]|nr:hypothetical protein [Alcanivoracaceae bacterium]PNE03555.1 hypothetical protein A15D_00775 [Alcanivorax sp. MD8A]
MILMRNLLAAWVLATGLFLAPVSAWSANSPEQGARSSEIHPAIAAADAQREKEARRKRYLLLFPAAVVVITVGLIVITRRK